MAVLHLSAQKKLHQIWSAGVYMPPNLSATPGESRIKCYSLAFYLYAPICSAPADHRFYLCALMQSANTRYVN